MRVAKNYIRTAEIDVSVYFDVPEGEKAIITIREMDTNDSTKLLGSRSDTKKVFSIFFEILREIILEHPFDDENGVHLSNAELVTIISKSEGLATFLMRQVREAFLSDSRMTTPETLES